MWDWTENKIDLVCIRHGTTQANREHRYAGRLDEPLSAEGIRELRRAKHAGCYPDIDYLFSSPMKRCLETARLLYPGREAGIIPDWAEMDFGIFEGKNYMDLQGDAAYQAWVDSNGTLPFPGGESREDFIRRCERGLYQVAGKLSELLDGGERRTVTVGCIVHGGTIMSLLSRFYGGEYFDYQTANGRGYRCSLAYSGGKIRLDRPEEI